MIRSENRWNAVAIGTLLALFAALVLFLNGCSWDFARDSHDGHSVEHHGDFHHGPDCAVCTGDRPHATATAVCPHCGGTSLH